MEINPVKIMEIYSYLTAVGVSADSVKSASGAFVFSRADKLLAQKVVDLYLLNKIKYVMFTGGIGKDSGPLIELDLPESAYQAAMLTWSYNVGFPFDRIFVETKATNGAQNSRFGIDKIIEIRKQYSDLNGNIIIVAHATSLRRLWAAHLTIARERHFDEEYQLVATDYNFDPEDPIDQKEAVEELLRLADWPKKEWAIEQNDLPIDLVSYARKCVPMINK